LFEGEFGDTKTHQLAIAEHDTGTSRIADFPGVIGAGNVSFWPHADDMF
jgi:hypothetical protein